MKLYTVINIRLTQSDEVDDELLETMRKHASDTDIKELMKKGIIEDIKDMWGESEGFDCKVDIIRQELKD